MKLAKIKDFAGAFLKGKVIVDYAMEALGRERRLKVPTRTNYIRINTLELVAEEIYNRQVKGSVAELGVYKGNFAKYIIEIFPDRTFYLFDTFEGFRQEDIAVEKSNNFSTGDQSFADTSVDMVLQKMKHRNKCVVHKGYFPESLNGLEDTFAFVSLDADLYLPILKGLEYFYPRLSKGGYIFIHDYNNSEYTGAKQAVREYCSANGIAYVPMSDNWGTVIIAK